MKDRYRRPWRVALAATAAAVTVLALTLVGSGSGGASAPVKPGPLGSVTAATQTGVAAPGRAVQAASSSKPFVPTAAQRLARDRALALKANLTKPPLGAHTTQADVRTTNPGPATTPVGAQAASTFTVFKNSKIPSSCAGCGQSTVNEPTTANAGKTIMQTSNWNIAYSIDGAATWAYQSPYALFGPSFCCDQAVLYEPTRNRFYYVGLDYNPNNTSQTGLAIAATSSGAPTSWCTYHFNAGQLGGTAGQLLDYPKIAYANNNLYLTWNRYNGNGVGWLSTGMARLPLDAIGSCAGFNYSFLDQTNNFTFALTQGASSLDTFYWVSNWYAASGGSGSSLRIYSWAENSGTYFFNDRNINPYNFAGGSCASQDGVVANWCSRLDPRWETPWISRAEYRAQANSSFAGDSILGVALTAGPSGFTSFPYVLYEYFKLNSLTYIGNDQTFNSGFAFAYPGCTVNVHGHVGCVMSYGGGTGSTHYFPGGFVLLQDDINPTQPWGYSFFLSGIGNASGWGDYVVAEPFQPAVGPFIATAWRVNGAVEPHVVVWGRGRDSGGYNRWKLK